MTHKTPLFLNVQAQMFMLADVQDDSWNKFATSGLTNCGCTDTCCSNYSPKKSWYIISTMNKLLNYTRFEADLTTQSGRRSGDGGSGGNGAARVVKFKRDPSFTDGPEAVYVAWFGSKTSASAATTIAISEVSGNDNDGGGDASAGAGAGVVTAVLTTLVGNSTTGLQTALPIAAGGKVTVTVTEMPIFILVGQGLAPAAPIGPVPPIDPPVAKVPFLPSFLSPFFPPFSSSSPSPSTSTLSSSFFLVCLNPFLRKKNERQNTIYMYSESSVRRIIQGACLRTPSQAQACSRSRLARVARTHPRQSRRPPFLKGRSCRCRLLCRPRSDPCSSAREAGWRTPWISSQINKTKCTHISTTTVRPLFFILRARCFICIFTLSRVRCS